MCRRCWRAEKANTAALQERAALQEGAARAAEVPPELLPIALDRPGLRWVSRHFARLAALPPARFAFRLYAELLVLSLFVSIVVVGPWGLPDRTDLAAMDDATLFWGAVVVAPLGETLMFQSLFCAFGRMLRLGYWGQLVLVWAPFALTHFAVGIGTGLCAGIVGGFYFAFAYVTRRAQRRSFAEAYFVTAALHALNNALMVALMLLERHGLI